MAYRPKHNYRSKDALERGDPDKRVMGQELSEDFEAISADLHSKESQINEIIQNGGGGGTGGPVSWGDVTGKPTEFPPSAHDHDGVYAPISHTHEIDDVNGLQDALDAAGGTPAWDDVTGKPAEFPPEAHTHEQGDVDGLELRLEAIEDSITSGGGFVDAPNDGKLYGRQSEAWEEVVIPDAVDPDWADIQNKPTEYPPEAHTQGWDTITDKPSEYPPEAHTQGWDTITGKPTEYPPESHTHQQGDIDGLEDKLVDIEGAIGELTGQLAFGGSYDASTGLVVTGNLSEYVDGQPLPDSSSVLNTFVIVSVAGNNPEELDEGDWLVAGSSGWVAIKYGTAGSVAWDNIVDKPSDYPPSSHGHEIAEINGLSDALTDAGAPTAWDDVTGKPTEFPPEDHTHDQYLTDAPNDGKQYVRKSEAWAEISTSDGGSGGSIQDGDTDGQVTTWSDSAQEWTPDSSLIVDASGNLLIATTESPATIATTSTEEGLAYQANDYLAISRSANQPLILNRLTDDGPIISLREDGTQRAAISTIAGSGLAFGTGSLATERMRIDASGNVGIGTDSPAFSSGSYGGLHIHQASGTALRLTNTASGQTSTDGSEILLDPTTADILYVNRDSAAQRFYTGGTERMRIDASGNVGINTTNPITDLTVCGDVSSTNIVNAGHFSQDTGSATVVGSGVQITLASNRNKGRAAAIGAVHESGTNAHALLFYTNSNGGSPTERMRIDASGNVGIGGGPSTALSDGVVKGPVLTISSSDSDPGDRDTVGAFTFLSNDGAYKTSYPDRIAAQISAVSEHYTGNRYGLSFYTGNASASPTRGERLRIDSAGNVGIGGTPGTREAGEYLEQAKTQLAGWKTTFDDRLKAEPKADKKAVTLEITDDEFDTFPTEETLVEKLTARSIGGGDAKLQVAGNGFFSGSVTATGNITAYSDERLKSDIETLDGSKVYEMRGVSFIKDGEAGSGVIAQELQKVAPELVNDSGEYLSVAYGNLVGYLIEAVKELKAEIEDLKRG